MGSDTAGASEEYRGLLLKVIATASGFDAEVEPLSSEAAAAVHGFRLHRETLLGLTAEEASRRFFADARAVIATS